MIRFSIMANNTSFQTKVHNSITKINKDDWDSLFPSNPEDYNFFKTVEKTLSDQFNFYYLVVYEHTDTVCIAPFFTMNYDITTTLEGRTKIWIRKFLSKFRKLCSINILVCGFPLSDGKIGLKNYQDSAVIKILINKIFDQADRINCRLIAFKDFEETSLKIFGSSLNRKFHRMTSYPSTEIKLTDYNSFDQYLTSLSKSTRKNLKRKFQQITHIPINMEVTNNVVNCIDEIYELYLQTYERSDIKFEKLSKKFFQSISEYMPAQAKYFLWRIDRKIVAFDLCLVNHGTLTDEYIGFDYTVAFKYHLYYVTYRDIYNWCLENKVQTYQGGMLNYDPKKRLDFTFNSRHILFRHKNVIIHAILSFLSYFIKPENFDPTLKKLYKSPKIVNLFFLKIFGLIFFADLLESVADLFFKKGVITTGIIDVTFSNAINFMYDVLISPALWLGIIFYILNFLLWILALSAVDLSVAFPIGCTTYIIVPLLSMMFLNERVVWSQWIGIIFIISGVIFISKSTKQPDDV